MDFEGMRYFVAIAETGSITSAAKRLSTTKSKVSRRLAAYEDSIGSTLLRRSTRALSLTDIGQRHYERVRDLIIDAESAFAETKQANQEPTGLLRISASQMGGQHLLAPFVFEFMAKYPKVNVELKLTDDIVDVIGESIDFTLRMGDLNDSELLVRRLGVGRRIIVASPKLLTKYGEPDSIRALKRLPAAITSDKNQMWRFASGESVSVDWRMVTASIPLAVDAAVRALGMTLVPAVHCSKHLSDGTLVQVLPNEPLPAVDISLVYPRLQHKSPAAKAFLMEILEATEYNWPSKPSMLAELS